MRKVLIAITVMTGLYGCSTTHTDEESSAARIVSLDAGITESLFALGMGEDIIGVDVTSTFPPEVSSVPHLGHVSSLQGEQIIAMHPTIVIAKKGDVKPGILSQIKAAGIDVHELDRTYTVDGTKDLLEKLGKLFHCTEKAGELISGLTVPTPDAASGSRKKVLFIYSRGPGNMLVAGDDTPIGTMLNYAGADNAVTGFEGYKPLSTEVLVAADPDVLLLFQSAFDALDGKEGVLAIPGVLQTKAGQNSEIIAMNGHDLSAFGPRVNQSIEELHTKLYSPSIPN